MSEGWKRIDLEGGGLQAANLRLAARLRRRGHAFALLAAFPAGLHRAYLDHPRGAWCWRIGSAAAAVAVLWGPDALALVAGGALVAGLAWDACWIDRRVTALNKRIRVEAWLGHGAAPPAGYRGRIADDELDDYLREKDRLAGSDPPAPASRRRFPGLAEQERMLARRAREKPPVDR